jgi:hypothetical protein
MPEPRPAAGQRQQAAEAAQDQRYQALRQLGALAHQVRAGTRAADHFIAMGVAADRDTASWLMSTAVDQSTELARELDGLARGLKDAPTDVAFMQAVQALRVRAHQLHAAARAADHFLELEEPEDHDTGSWLIASARGLADRLAAGIDDAGGSLKRQPEATVIDAQDAALLRRVGQAATTPVRGAA